MDTDTLDVRKQNEKTLFWGNPTCIAGVRMGYIRLPQSQKQCVYLSKAYCYFLWEKKFLAVRRIGRMTRCEYRVDRPFPVT